jgi:hypothetical protein
MAILLDVASLLVFPGLVFTIAGGVVTVWAARWLGSLTSGEERVSWGQLASRSNQLLDLAIHPAAEELDRASGLVLAGIVAAASASTCLWRAMLAPAPDGWSDLYVLLPLLATPTLVAFAWSDWRARSKGLGREREALLVAYTGILFVALGGLAFLVAALAATAHLALVDTVLDGCLGQVSGAVQALLIQLLRAANWFVIASALTVLFWVPPVAAVIAIPVALAEYAVMVVLLVALRQALRRPKARLLVDVGWLPLGAAALLSLALTSGGW